MPPIAPSPTHVVARRPIQPDMGAVIVDEGIILQTVWNGAMGRARGLSLTSDLLGSSLGCPAGFRLGTVTR
jgi:hypothetical protein